MKFPEEVRDIVRDANENNPSNIEDATTEALNGVRGLPSFDELIDDLVEHSVRDLVTDDRHSINTRIKYQAGAYFQKTKTVVGDSTAVMRAEISVYEYRIAGTSLGDVLGKDLLDIAGIEDSIIEGHVFNSRLVRRLSDIVPQDKKVKQAINQKKLKALFSELQAVPEKEQEAAKEPNVQHQLAGV